MVAPGSSEHGEHGGNPFDCTRGTCQRRRGRQNRAAPDVERRHIPALPFPVTDIRASWPVRVPLAIRSRVGLGGEVLGTPIEGDTCYLTDDEFCTEGWAGIILGEGLRRLDVTVHYGTELVGRRVPIMVLIGVLVR